jgi:Undecaprenyl-phosphate glucose phosphotransferase
MFRVRALLTNTYLAIFDLAVTAACYLGVLALELRVQGVPATGPTLLASERVLALGWILGVWLALLGYFGMYQSRRMAPVFADLGILAKVSVAGLIVLEALAHFVPALQPRPLFLVCFAAAAFLVLCLARVAVRALLRELRRRGYNIKHLVLVTTPGNAERLTGKIQQRAHYGYRVVRRLEWVTSGAQDSERLAQEFRETLQQCRVDDVILALRAEARSLMARLVEECEACGVNVRLVPDLFPLIQRDTQVDDLDGVPLIDVHLYPTESLGYVVLKRFFDVSFALLLLVVFSPAFVLIALLVKLTSPGPVFFKQKRVGLNGRKFRMLKFRTMRAGASLDPETHWTTRNERHVTPVGRWLRRSNLDELPQFLNVLKGDMSIVGPRPERPHFIERFRQEFPQYMLRHYIKCGITGWAQVNGWRGDTSIRERVAHDLYYLENWDFTLDLKILVWTVTRTFFHPNAY